MPSLLSLIFLAIHIYCCHMNKLFHKYPKKVYALNQLTLVQFGYFLPYLYLIKMFCLKYLLLRDCINYRFSLEFLMLHRLLLPRTKFLQLMNLQQWNITHNWQNPFQPIYVDHYDQPNLQLKQENFWSLFMNYQYLTVHTYCFQLCKQNFQKWQMQNARIHMTNSLQLFHKCIILE